jgi:hypothetical protein
MFQRRARAGPPGAEPLEPADDQQESTPAPATGARSGLQARVIRRAVLISFTGLITFVLSNLLQDPLNVSLGDQLILTALVGGITLLSQFLAEFSERLVEFGADLDRRERESNSLRQLMDSSALQTDLLTRFVRRAGRVDATSSELVRDFIHLEVERVSALMRKLSRGEEVFYDGEDREYLLGLAESARTSIVATSLTTVDAGVQNFEGGLWLSDLGVRYLDVQRAASHRGVTIRRIFVFDSPEFQDDASFVWVRRQQLNAGVEIRGLAQSEVPSHLLEHIADFIVFDGAVAYETQRSPRKTTAVQPTVIKTWLVMDKARVQRSIERFEELWEAAEDPDQAADAPDSSPGEAGPAATAV